MVDQPKEWSTIDPVNYFNLNRLIFFLKGGSLNYACVFYLTVSQ